MTTPGWRPPASPLDAEPQAGATFEVRQPAFEDFSEVKRLFRALHEHNARLDARFALGDHWEAQLYSAFTDGLGHHDQLWLLARDDVREIGFLWGKLHRDQPVYKYREWAELIAIYVDPQRQAHGVGHAMVEHLKSWALSVGQESIQAFVTASNERALSFYEREGFVHSQSIVRLILAR